MARQVGHTRERLVVTLAAALASAVLATAAQAPTNDLPNPYQTIAHHFTLPDGRVWGATSAVDVDRDGTSIWVGERCGANTCLGSTLDPILKFDASGRLLASFGAGTMIFPHGFHVDRDGNVWITDGQDNRPRRARGAPADSPLLPAPATLIGHQVFKYSPQGKLLMTLGKAGGGRDAEYFYQPNDVLVAPNGDIFVSEGHSSAEGSNARILKFDRTGRFIRSFGRFGKGPGEFDQPHALAMDSKGRLFVGDRSNNRIQILDQDGTYLAEWTQFSRPSGIAIDRDDNIYVADSESGSVNPAHGEWKRGIRIGSAKDGSIRWFIPDPWPTCKPDQRPAPDAPCASSTSGAEGVAVDRAGNVYGAEVGPRAVKKYVRSQNRR
ncbi:MAG TPA: peptidyl-alpha-hydroxyglycine alpha-amidating lyase family protein [Vicinamibacterales bacterium]|nr:peptidyl-alpha-hydroxyglycine alpha-amidating lyase family protein [Vicinamibacterales bacterium]